MIREYNKNIIVRFFFSGFKTDSPVFLTYILIRRSQGHRHHSSLNVDATYWISITFKSTGVESGGYVALVMFIYF